MTDAIKGYYSLVNQIERSATSIGANIGEANYGHGRADFISKFENAFKVCHETEYGLDILFEIGYMLENTYKSLRSDCRVIRRMLISLITTPKQKL